jgi:gliding motility-associated-like protein
MKSKLRFTYISLFTVLLFLAHVGRTKTNEFPPPTVGCPDGQGLNALSNGDFGSGVSNILQTDPGIAPGYTYTTNPPPEDGFYTITNNTGPWGSFAANWIDIGDNSPDPNGYMMVVNATVNPGIFYTQTVAVCGGSEYQFSADIINLLLPTLPGEILPNVDFLVDGSVLFSTGNIPQNGQWQNVGFVFTTAAAQTSINIAIRNNAPGGQGNDLALDNIAFFTCGPALNLDLPIFVCGAIPFDLRAQVEGGSYNNPFFQWQQSPDGISWSNIPGANTLLFPYVIAESTFFRLLVSDGIANIDEPNCRAVSPTTLITLSGVEADESITLCDGEQILVGDSLIDQAGVYDLLLKTPFGCDSLLRLTIIETQRVTVQQFDTICFGELYQGALYNESTLLIDTLTGSSGCDSINQLFLFVDRIDLILPQDIVINQGDQYTITPTASGNIVQWNWSPDTFISCVTCPVVDVNPSFTTRYYLDVVSENNCVDSASILIEVQFEKNIYIPSAFSPNNDGINDIFFPFANQNIIGVEELFIFDRWGAKVFEAQNTVMNDRTLGWDGTLKNKPAPEGVYVYHASFLAVDGNIETRQGDLLLLR